MATDVPSLKGSKMLPEDTDRNWTKEEREKIFDWMKREKYRISRARRTAFVQGFLGGVLFVAVVAIAIAITTGRITRAFP
jgi:hypothetical protein